MSSVYEAHTLVIKAAADALDRHGPLTHDVSRALHILAEEVGEAHQAYLGMTRLKPSNTVGALIHELAQVAATAELILANLIEEREQGVV